MENKLKSSLENKKVGFTSVVGDLLHAGHVVMLDECKMYCDYLYVGIIIDPTKDRSFKNKPIQSSFERYCQVVSHRSVDEVIPLDGENITNKHEICRGRLQRKRFHRQKRMY